MNNKTKFTIDKTHIHWGEEHVSIVPLDSDVKFISAKVVLEDSFNELDIYRIYVDSNKGLETFDIKMHKSFDCSTPSICPADVVNGPYDVETVNIIFSRYR